MAAAVRTRRLRWSMFWAVVSYAVTTLGAALTSYLTSFEVTPVQGSLISTGVGLGVVMIGAFIDHARSSPMVVDPGPVHYPNQRRPQQTGRTSFAVALVLMLVLCGGGGLAVTYGAHWAAQKVVAFAKDKSDPPWEKKTKEPGVQRLAKPVTKSAGDYTVTINSVEVNSQVTMINVTATNSGNSPIGARRAQLSVPGSNTLQPDHAVSEFLRGDAPPGGEYTQKIVFDGVVGGDVTKVTLAFTNIFSMDFGAPNSLSIDIPLTRI